MAGLKKKKKEKSTNPNLALVISVVLLFLVTIILGVFIYSQLEEQQKLRESTIAMRKEKDAEKVAGAYYSMLTSELRLAVGDTLTEEDIGRLNADREHFQKENFGKFKEEKTKEAMRKLLDELKLDLGVDAATQNFQSNYKKRVEAAVAKARQLEGELTAAKANQKTMETFSVAIKTKQDEFYDNATKQIADGNAAALKAAQARSKSFGDVTKANDDLRAQLKAEGDKIGELQEDHAKQIKFLKKQMAEIDAERKELAGGGNAAAPGMQAPAGSFAPLLLDISTGKPLWDTPVGKVTRIEADLRQIAINIGSGQGAKPELTFNVFGAGPTGRAEKQLKGSIEIVKVLDANTSLARVTSLYDVEGREIQLNDQSRSRIVREAEMPIREGDLLFNLFWGTRVALAGYVSVTGDLSDNPAEQIRQMEDFRHLLLRNGMQVDAYVDLRDGQLRGRLTGKTRYLIVGDDLKAAGKAAKEGEDKDQPGGDRAKAVNEGRATLIKESMQRGLLMISAENFAAVIGYRRARNGNNPDLSTFRPTLPYAGVPGIGGVIEARPKVEEKAPEEKKEPEEKKDAN